MSLRNRPNDLNPLLRTGFVFLILASLARLLFYRSLNLTAALTDGAIGLLYGVSIACLLLGLRMNSRRRCASDARPGA